MRSIRRRTALAVAALGITAALAVPAMALFLSPTAGAGHVAPDAISVQTDGDERLQFQMNQPLAGQVDLSPNQAFQRIVPGDGCVALPVTAAPNQGVRCDAAQLTRLRVGLSPDADSFFHGTGTQAFNEIDDEVSAGAGPDFITTRNGDDVVNGGTGDDRLVTGAGADQVTGGTGEDGIDAGPGADAVNVRDGETDTVACGTGFDTVAADPSDAIAPDCERVSRI